MHRTRSRRFRPAQASPRPRPPHHVTPPQHVPPPRPIPRPRPPGPSDHGPNPYVVNINEATLDNGDFRRALWTGQHLQVTLMHLRPGEDIGLEMHPHVDQFLRIEQGQAIVQMGETRERLSFRKLALDDFAILIPAGAWHNVTNVGHQPLKLYSIYAPPNHPWGAVHPTKAIAEKMEGH